MYELLWYLFVAIVDGTRTRKASMAKYISYKPDKLISAPWVYVFVPILFDSLQLSNSR